jgi:uncharacterized protein (DUF58 family)
VTFSTESRAGRSATSATSTVTRTRYSTERSGVLVEAVMWWTVAARRLVQAWTSSVAFVRTTVTPAGWLIIGAATAGLAVGAAFRWIELVVAGIAAMVLLVLSVPFLFGAGSYRIDLSLTDERVVAGTEVVGTIAVQNVGRRSALPGRLDIPVGAGLVDVNVPFLRPGAQMTEALVVPAYRRGIILVGPATSVRGDPLGILRRARTWADRNELYVHPRTVVVPSTSAGFIRDLEGRPSTDIVDSDISFHAIREYAPGDSQRHIHWKSTAKTGQLMVRQYEETRRSKLALVLSRRADEFATEDEFEMAVSVVGSLGMRAIRDGRDITVVTGADLPEFVSRSVDATVTLRSVTTRSLLDELAGVESTPATTPIEGVTALTAQETAGLSIAFLVVGSPVGVRRLQAASLAVPLAASTVVVRCDPESVPSVRVLGSLTIMTIGILDDLRQLLARGAAS